MRLGNLGVLRRLARLDIVDRRLGPTDSGFGLGNARFVVVVLDREQQVTLVDPLEIIDGDVPDITFNLSGERRDIAIISWRLLVVRE